MHYKHYEAIPFNLLNKQVNELQQKIDEISSKQSGEEEHSELTKQQIEEHNQEIQSMKMANDNNIQEIQSLKSQIESTNQRLETTERQLNDKTKEIEESKCDTLRDHNKQIKKLNEELVEKTNIIDKLSDKTSRLAKRENQLAREKRTTEDELYEARNKLTDLKAEHEKLKIQQKAKPNQGTK